VIAAQGIRIYQPPIDTDDEAAAENARVLLDAMPFSIIGSTEDVTTADGRVVKGREYLWGVAEGMPRLSFLLKQGSDDVSAVENENHCDFRKLRSCLIRTHMLDLISTTEDIHYENYRQQQMETRKFGEPRVKKSDNPKFKEEEEALRKRFTEQVKSEEARFRQWEQHVSCTLIMHFSAHLCPPFPCSLLRNVIDSIRIWNTLTVPLRVLRLNWTTSKLATGGGPVDDRRPNTPLFFWYTHIIR